MHSLRLFPCAALSLHSSLKRLANHDCGGNEALISMTGNGFLETPPESPASSAAFPVESQVMQRTSDFVHDQLEDGSHGPVKPPVERVSFSLGIPAPRESLMGPKPEI
jgi:hypothetical protein